MPTPSEPNKDITSVSLLARIIPSFSSSLVLTYLGHPFDAYKNAAIAKASEKKPTQALAKNLTIFEKIYCNTILPKDMPERKRHRFDAKTSREKHRLMYRGVLGYGFYKISNTMLNQAFMIPGMELLMTLSIYQGITQSVSEANARIIASSIVGGCTGIFETLFLPIDRAKFRSEVYKIPMRVTLREIFSNPLSVNYAGMKDTAVRNCIGSGSLAFGKFVSYRAMGVTDYNNPTQNQLLASSLSANICRVTFSHLPDISKAQKQDHPEISGGMIKRLDNLYREKGLSGFTPGATAKLISATKGTLFFYACESITLSLNKSMKEKERTIAFETK